MPDEFQNSTQDSNAEIERLEARRDELLRRQENEGLCNYWIAHWMVAHVRHLVDPAAWVWVLDCRNVFQHFVLDSAEVQSQLAIFLHKLGEGRISKWLYGRALTK
jgi:hypothetical protein